MEQAEYLLKESILRDMAEGVMTIGLDGVITSINPAGLKILHRRSESLLNKKFAACFFEFEQNDAFNQAVLDAIYHCGDRQERHVAYYDGTKELMLRLSVSYLRQGEARIGIVLVFSDESELSELRNALLAMERIRELNQQLSLRNALLQETFGRYMSDELVHEILENRDGLVIGGKKQDLTVMMSDLRGFTVLSDRMDAQALLDMLNHYLGEMTKIIRQNSGTIIEFIGDGIMAIFGAPIRCEEHAEYAVKAAVEMQREMAKINAWNREKEYPTLRMGIGIHSGEMIVGNIGSQIRAKYGVTGSGVNLCGRIEGYTVGGQILISMETRNRIKQELEIGGVYEVLPKGVSEPARLMLVNGIGNERSETEEEEKLTDLEEAITVRISRVVDKMCESVETQGMIVAMSKHRLLLQTGLALKAFDDLRLDGSETVYCKVMEKRENGWLLQLTAGRDEA